MSIRGRYWIDRLKRYVSGRLRFPCPPYDRLDYWDGVYERMGDADLEKNAFEWANMTLKDDLLVHSYRQDYSYSKQLQEEFGFRVPKNAAKEDEIISTTFGEVIGLDDSDEGMAAAAAAATMGDVLILGCGNSAFGEEMLKYQNGPWQQQTQQQENNQLEGAARGKKNSAVVHQVDISPTVVAAMAKRYQEYIHAGTMNIVQDDATKLTAFQNDSFMAVIDKGFLDAVFCTDHYTVMHQSSLAVHRILRPGGVFAFFSYSRPQFLLFPLLMGHNNNDNNSSNNSNNNLTTNHHNHQNHNGPSRLWDDIQIRNLNSMFLYRFVKRDPSTIPPHEDGDQQPPTTHPSILKKAKSRKRKSHHKSFKKS